MSDSETANNEGFGVEQRESEPEIEIVGESEHPPTASVKLHGPPGCGKTTQTMERLKRLISEEGFSVSDICFVTYRREMAERFLEKLHDEELIDWGARMKPWEHSTRYVGTLHAVCNRISDLDSPSSDNQSLGGLMHKFCLDRYGVPYYKGDDETQSTPGELMFSARSHCIENQIPFDKWHLSPQYSQVSDVWEYRPELPEFDNEWTSFKRENEIADFEDMLTGVLESGAAPPRKILAVDEFHDFTPIQNEIVTQWMEKAEIVIVNGDPLQVVYNYKGADPSYYLDLDLPEVLLPQSYRVPQRVWEYATRALRPDHEPPNIQPKTPEIDPENYRGEVRDVLSNPLGETSHNDGRSPVSFIEEFGDDTMFLVRTRPQQRDIGRALKEAGVIFASQDGGGGWNQASKRLGIYRVLASLSDVRAPERFPGQQSLVGYGDNDPNWGADKKEGNPPSSIWAYASEWESFLDRVPAGYLEGITKKKLLSRIKAEDRLSGDEMAAYFTREFWDHFTRGADSTEFLLSYSGSGLIARALRRYDCDPKRGRMETRIQTIHASKGGEAETVILYDGIPPRVAAEIQRNDDERENEARLWYVGCTRASHRLVIARNGWDWARNILPETAEIGGAQ